MLLYLGVLLCFAGCSEERLPSADSWVDFTSPDGTIIAKFPEKPEVRKKSQKSPAGRLKMRNFVHDDDAKDILMVVGKTEYPVTSSEFAAEKCLRSSCRAEVEEFKGKILSEKDIQMYGLTGREFSYEIHEGTLRLFVRNRFFVDPRDPTVYQIKVMSEKRDVVEGMNAGLFFDSFRIDRKQLGKGE
jgi:hypothetical protein